MDLARPAGIVMHASLGDMIPAELVEFFELSSVYVRGIADNQPVPVYSLKGVTSIPVSATSPPSTPRGVVSKKWTVGEMTNLGQFVVDVSNKVTNSDDVFVRLYTPGSLPGLRTYIDVTEFKIRKVADTTEIVSDMKPLKPKAQKHGDDKIVELEVKYRQQ
jgi:hypothetical protein